MSIARELSERFRCPSCFNSRLYLSYENDIWIRCPDCLADFHHYGGIPFLCTSNMLRVLETGASPPEDLELLSICEDAVMAANIKYHDAYAGDYENDISTTEMFTEGGACQHRIKETLEQAGRLTEGGFLLDVCCGTGNVLQSAQSVFDETLGLDVSVNMMNIARKRGFEVLGADAGNIPFQDESVNCVTAFSALHHIFDYKKVVREMARVLKTGGVFYSDWDPNGKAVKKGWAVKLALRIFKAAKKRSCQSSIPESQLQAAAEFHHHSEQGFSGEEAADCLREAGFSQVELYYHINPPSFQRSSDWGVYGYAMAFLKAISFLSPRPEDWKPFIAIVAIK